MTSLHVLGSGSAGNAFAISCDGETLLVDAGFSAREIERRSGTAGFDLGTVQGIVLTHEHNDHTAGAARLAHRLGVPVLASIGTWDRLRHRAPTVRFEPLRLMGAVGVGGFRIEACPTSHDAAEPVALAVTTGSGNRIGIAYDLGRPTTAVRYLLRDMDALVLEANHDDILLRTSDYPAAVRDRIGGSTGHLSNRAAAELLAELLNESLELVVLAHLSAHCNTPEEARAAVEPVLAHTECALHVALQERPLPPFRLRGLRLRLSTPSTTATAEYRGPAE
jgi:phosphoribosyl 1,2-cyclic phosphodiesterase